MIRGGELISKRSPQHHDEAAYSACQMQRMRARQNVEKRAMQRRRKVNAGLYQLTPNRDLAGEKTEAQDSTDKKPLPNDAERVLPDGSSSELNGNAAGNK